MNARMQLTGFATAVPAARAALTVLGKSVEDSGLEEPLTRTHQDSRIANQRIRLLRPISPQRRAQAKCPACKTRPGCRVERHEALHRKREGCSRMDRGT